MSFRNRPVLDRKHRPRWQDELRTQQLVVAGFAIAIAVAVGIFAAATWSNFYQANLRQAALVGGQPVERAAVEERINIVAAELQARAADLNSQSGGQHDDAIQQQLQQLSNAFSQVDQEGAVSLVTGILLDQLAAQYGLSVSSDAVDDEVAVRRATPERRQLSYIMALPKKDEGAAASDKPTDKNWADAKARIDAIKAELDDGGDFVALAKERSDEPTKADDGLIGWVQADDAQYGDYFKAANGAEVGAVVGPLKNDRGWYLLKVDDLRPAGDNEPLRGFLNALGVSDGTYRDYVRQELLRGRYRDYFAETIVAPYQSQRKVSQIRIDNDEGAPGPKSRIRHLLVAPLPGAQDQSKATAKQWRAALIKARELRAEAVKPDADWTKLAAENSDDPGSKSKGGVLGWYSLGTLTTQFVPEFASAVAALDVGEVSEPVRSDFGYHIIEVTETRASALDFAQQLAKQVKDDPDSFADVAKEQSDDQATAPDGGALGWVIRYQLDAARQAAIFALTKPGQISEPVGTTSGIYIFKLDATAEQSVPAKQRESVGSSGFSQWIGELRDQAGVWVDPEFAATTTSS